MDEFSSTLTSLERTLTPTTSEPAPVYRFSVAPMMDWTTPEYRQFARLLTRRALLYTEMITTGALLYGDRDRFLRFGHEEHPIAVQLGGSNPGELAQCAAFAEAAGYDEVNLNVGCPSDRVQNNRIGACLMAEPATVADAVKAMRDRVSVPVTVKHRIGIDGRESYQQLCDFVGTVAEAGCERFIVHARIAVLEGLSPKQNREVPPLKYEWVSRLKQDFPHLAVILNGGLKELEICQDFLEDLDGVMVGREAYQNPWILSQVDPLFYGKPSPARDRHQVIEELMPYVERHVSAGQPLNHITRHILGLFHGQPGGRQFRRHLSENAHKSGADQGVLAAALARVSRHSDLKTGLEPQTQTVTAQ
ncbi:MAG: tRNA dihydrouridine(20/20a) synthase DusA [Alteromonadaceae bacterium]|nr:tRNA dihydrouridine(20/20a) synthase DusA [Alteromonadaceae bacterium]